MTSRNQKRAVPVALGGAYTQRGRDAMAARGARTIGALVALMCVAGAQGHVLSGAASPRAVAAAGATAYVSPHGADRNRCDRPAAPCATIGAALRLVGRNGTIQIAAGVYHEHLTLAADVALLGANSATTVVDGDGRGQAVTVDKGAHVLLRDLTLQHGHAPDPVGHAGGLANDGVVTVIDSRITANTANFAAAGIANAGLMTLVATTVDHNKGGPSGTGGIANTGVITIDNSIIGDNVGEFAGGLYTSGAAYVSGSTLSGNSANGGGGIGAQAGTLMMTNSTLTGNWGMEGGGLSVSGGSVVTVTNSTIAGNTAEAGAGGLFLQTQGLTPGSPPQVSLGATIIAGNHAINEDCTGIVHSLGYNLLGIDTDPLLAPASLCYGIVDGVNGDQVGTAAHPIDPLLGPLQHNGGPTATMALPPGSPAIDAGPPDGCRDGAGNALTADQRGDLRPYPAAGRCDIGAYEFGSTAPPTPTPPPTNTPTPALSAGTWTSTNPPLAIGTGHTATLLRDGTVLVVGGSAPGASTPTRATNAVQLFDPGSGRWHAGPPLRIARTRHTATLLADGRVLVTGGFGGDGMALRSAEIYDPRVRRWSLTAPMRVGRGNHTATLLADGHVLVAGGSEWAPASELDSEPGVLAADLYDVRQGAWTSAGTIVPSTIQNDGGFHSAVHLSTGAVLLANPSWTEQDIAIYTPRSHAWSVSSTSPLAFRTGVMFAGLNDGRLLATGGQTQSTGIVAVGGDSAVYDPAHGRWALRATLPQPVSYGAAVTLRDGRVLVMGGTTGAAPSAAAQEYTPQTDTWREAPSMRRAHGPGLTATVLRDGRVLVIGGGTESEIFTPAGH